LTREQTFLIVAKETQAFRFS